MATWKDIPAGNEVQNQISNVTYSSGNAVVSSGPWSFDAFNECVRLYTVFFFLVDVAQQKLSANNIFTIAKRTVEGQASVNIHLQVGLFENRLKLTRD